jgi:fermentation-respiration switch protein FrsA (DUF1100 family)
MSFAAACRLRPRSHGYLGGMIRMPAGRVALVALVLLGMVGCGRDHAVEATGPYAVGTRSVTFVDDSRPTAAFGSFPGAPDRTLVTDFWYPAAGDPAAAPAPDAEAADGPFPLILFNHGQQGAPEQYAQSFQTWARAGYVVAAPRHPLTIKGGPGAVFVDDIEGELGDVPFVVKSIDDQMSDLVDVDHLVLAGHSSGAIVAYGDAFNTCCHFDDPDAVLLEALTPIPLAGKYSDSLKGTPVLFMHGDADQAQFANAHAVFDEQKSPRFFLTIPGGDHSQVYRDSPQTQMVADTALAFFDRYVKGRHQAGDSLDATPGIEAKP